MRSQEISKIANTIGIPEKTMVCIARDARESGLIKKKGRGVSCPKFTKEEKLILVEHAIKSAYLGGRTIEIDKHFSNSRGKIVHCDLKAGVLCRTRDGAQGGMVTEVSVPPDLLSVVLEG